MLSTCRDTARPGVKESEVYGGMMKAMIANGGEEPTLFLWACDALPIRIRSACRRRGRSRAAISSFAKSIRRSAAITPMSSGHSALAIRKPEQRRIYDGCVAAYEEGMKNFGPGRPISVGNGQGARRDPRARPRHVRDRHPRPRAGVAGISALPPSRARGRSGGAEEARRRIPYRHGVRVQHRPVRSEISRRQDRLRLRRDRA